MLFEVKTVLQMQVHNRCNTFAAFFAVPWTPDIDFVVTMLCAS
jgi:hypothetical protein